MTGENLAKMLMFLFYWVYLDNFTVFKTNKTFIIYYPAGLLS